MAIQLMNLALTLVCLCYYARTCGSSFIHYKPMSRNDPLNNVDVKRSERGEHHDGFLPEQTSTNTMLLDSILNLRVLHESQLCSRKLVIMFLTTGDLNYLRECTDDGLRQEQQSFGEGSSSDSASTRSSDNVMSSYSGRLLKRILQNMNNGLPTGEDSSHGVEQAESEKRSRPRLSINVALSSLADMLRHQSRRHHHGHQYGFRQRLLNLG